MAELKDSGARREFESGAVRDVDSVEKGRCDLLPLDIVSDLLKFGNDAPHLLKCVPPLELLSLYLSAKCESPERTDLVYTAIESFCDQNHWDIPTGILEVAIHFADGSKKYGERNWEKGIPCHCYIDSAVRHYLKWNRGDVDEPHDRAFLWNLLCLLWTIRHRPECNDLWRTPDGDRG